MAVRTPKRWELMLPSARWSYPMTTPRRLPSSPNTASKSAHRPCPPDHQPTTTQMNGVTSTHTGACAVADANRARGSYLRRLQHAQVGHAVGARAHWAAQTRRAELQATAKVARQLRSVTSLNHGDGLVAGLGVGVPLDPLACKCHDCLHRCRFGPVGSAVDTILTTQRQHAVREAREEQGVPQALPGQVQTQTRYALIRATVLV